MSYGDWAEWKQRVWERWNQQRKNVQAAVTCLDCQGAKRLCEECRAATNAWGDLLVRKAGGVGKEHLPKETLAREAAG